jgi:NSS family neurotransmitter:Na+ symporter
MPAQAPRDQWSSRAGFVLATVGAAVGMGNLWRFPYQAYTNGGGAFLIPYFVALLTAGVPLMILEFGFGQRMRGAAPLAFARLGRRWEWLGWWPVFIPVIVMCFYSTVIAWSINYFIYALTQAWGPDPGSFFSETFLQVSDGPLSWGGFRWRTSSSSVAGFRGASSGSAAS